MKLHNEWRIIVRKAWSFRLLILAAFLSGLEVAMPYVAEKFPVGIFATISFFVTMAAMIARVIAQPKMERDDA